MSVSTATDQRIRYYAERLSDHIAETPEKYLVCTGTVIGRSGSQKYLVGELTDPEGIVKDRNPGEEVEVWRPADEVFRPATLASFEGKTFTLRHPDKLIGPDEEREVSIGHIQNVRKGGDALESGDWPILADIIVKDPEGIRAVKSGDRELSCGYSYRLVKNGERLEQHDIIGNHVALVQSARAGNEARINDSAPAKEVKVSNFFKHIVGLGFKAFAAEEKDPEKISEALDQTSAAIGKAEGKADPPETQLKPAKDDKAKDDDRTKDDKAKDDDKVRDKAKDDDKSKDDKSKVKDDDRRTKLHSALDKILDAKEEEEKAGDADLQELSRLLQEFFKEEGAEEEHADADVPEELQPIQGEERKVGDDKLKVKVKDDECKDDKAKDDKTKDDAEIVRPEPKLEEKEKPEGTFDEARAVLKAIRPFVARSGNKKLIAAYDSEARRVRAGLTKADGNGGSYRDFLVASQTLSSKATDSKEGMSPAQKESADLDAEYKKQREALSAPFRPKK